MDGINSAGSSADVARIASTSASTTPTPVAPATAAVSTPAAQEAANLISLLADAAPPIDSKKVEAIQSLIAAGAYPIDPHAIAAKMLALDFPKSGADADA